MSGIVVGVDGSDESLAALRFAAEEARLRRVPLRAVIAWTLPVTGEIPGGLIAGLRAEFEEEAAKALDAVLGQIDGGGLTTERLVAEGPAARVLVEAAEGADMLVVGSRGRGGFTGLLLGSVSLQCAHHATCPVVIVRSRGEA
jgi:nucleotide-binding universal stress UspA family protein